MEMGNLLLEAVRAGIRGEKVNWEQMPEDFRQQLWELAQRHHVLPLFVEAVYACPAFIALPQDQQREMRKTAVRISASQTMRSALFRRLYRDMAEAGLHCLVVKGEACRSTYPVPGLRSSSDEDLLVRPDVFTQCCDFFTQHGLTPLDKTTDFECGFRSPDGLYIELHQSLFSPEATEMGDSNRYFSEAMSRAMPIRVEDTTLYTLSAHDHLLYLLLHAYKHFIHSGFGIRQICDIVLWAETYGDRIEWQRLFEQCEPLRCRSFAVSVFQIGKQYLGFRAEKAGIPKALLEEKTPYERLLADILHGGVYGGEELSRKHSGAVTVQQVRSSRGGAPYSLMKTVFPERRALEKDYAYLERYPVLLPVAWGQRLWKYSRELRHRTDSAASDTVRMSRQRAELFKELHIID